MKIIFLILLFFPVNLVFAYTPETTHAGLSEQAIYFYNSHSFNKLSDYEKEFIIDGSIAEDNPVVRVLNHFYDPIRNIGINNFRTAKNWATDRDTDNMYIWSEAIRLYAEGDKNKALVYLGHILHLIQDMTVPDHTRNDAHMGAGISGLYTGESSYEKWSSKNKNRQTLSGLITSFQGLSPIIFKNLEEYFDFLANYSNRNFFGDDSIDNKVYQYTEPKILEYKNGYVYSFDFLDLKKEKLLIAKEGRDGMVYYYLKTNTDTSVLSSYFDRLSKQAVLAGAGIIELFFREGELARKEYLKEKTIQSEAEIKKAIYLTQDLNNMGMIELFLFGFNSIIEDEIIVPIENATHLISDNFSLGSKIVYSQITNASSFLSFSSKVLIKTAIANTRDTIDKIISSTEIFTANNFKENLATVSNSDKESFELIVSKLNEDAIKENEQIKITEANIPQEEILEDNTTISPASLSEALLILDELSKNLPKQSIKETPKPYISTAYSPGFGGGEEPQSYQGPTLIEDSTLESEQNKEELNVSTTTSTTESVIETLVEVFEEIIPDTTAPDISLSIRECANSISLDNCLVATTTLSVFWNSNASDISHFEINKNGEISTTTATSTTVLAPDRSSINISVSAIDLSGNISETTTRTAKIFLSPIIINEIAWNGTTGHSEDEWIELYNRTDMVIDLQDWILFSKTDLSPYIKLEGKIPPGEYYLIERKNKDEEDESTQSPIKNIEADIWVDFGEGISNTGENLILSYSSTTIDEIPLLFNWAGKSNQRSIEKYDSDNGSDISNWASNSGEIRNGVSVSGAAVFGTPKARNSANYLINKNLPITKDLFLEKKNSPYYVLKNSFVRVYEGANLSIEPGVIIKFADGSGMVVDGGLISNGTEEDSIVFTSIRDDEYGGDTNRDGFCEINNASSTASCPYPGSFHGIWFSDKSASSTINNSIFRYGGMSDGTKRSLLYIEDAFVKIFDSSFEHSYTNGISLKNSNSILFQNIFDNNGSESNYAGLKITGGSSKIENNTFTSNSMGIYYINSGADILNNKFFKNKYKAISILNKPEGSILGNVSLNQESRRGEQINISGSISVLNSTTTLLNNPMPYFIYGTVSVVASSTLYIGEGTKIINSYSGNASRLSVDGKLIIDGNQDNPVIFLSDLTDATKNSWSGIFLNPGSFSTIKGAIFKDATKAISYFKSPIHLEDINFINNTIGIFVGSNPSPVERAINVCFEDSNLSTTSPINLW